MSTCSTVLPVAALPEFLLTTVRIEWGMVLLISLILLLDSPVFVNARETLLFL
jgi:hypothetical protein